MKQTLSYPPKNVLDTDVTKFITPLFGVFFCVFFSIEGSRGALVGATLLAASIAQWTRARSGVWNNEKFRFLFHVPAFCVLVLIECLLYWNTWTPIHVAIILLLGYAIGVVKHIPKATAFILKVCGCALFAQGLHFFVVAVNLKKGCFAWTEFDWYVHPGGELVSGAAMSVNGAFSFSLFLFVLAASFVMTAYFIVKRRGAQ